MADPFGISFSPTSQGGTAQSQSGARPTPIQQAIQTLSFKIPRVAGASAFTAQPLLTSPGGAGLGGNPNSAALLEQIRRMLFGDQSGPSGMTASPGLGNLGSLFGQSMPTSLGAQAGPMGQPSAPSSPSGTIPAPRIDPGSEAPRAPDPGDVPPPQPSPTLYPTPMGMPDQEPRDRRI